jgi:sulfur transfer complex TusBCD TusB component (DsrH family)
LLQDAVHLCLPGVEGPAGIRLRALMEKTLAVYVMTEDTALRGFEALIPGQMISPGDYDSLVDLTESSYRVVDML